MDNLINETNERIQQIIDNLETIKVEYERKIEDASKQFDIEVAKSKKYKEDFFTAKAKIDKMNKDIAGFEEDYKNLVDKFKDDELANILIAANKEISSKVDERKRKILKDRAAMNEVVQKAESVKSKMIKLTAEKKALESCLAKILDSYNYYTNALAPIIEFANEHRDNLCQNYSQSAFAYDQPIITDNTSYEDVSIDESLLDESILDDSILLDYREISEALKDSGDDDDFIVDNDVFKLDNTPKKEPRKDNGEVALVVEKSRAPKQEVEVEVKEEKPPVVEEKEEPIVIEDLEPEVEDPIGDTPVKIEEDNDSFNFDVDLENIINSDDSLE